MLTIYLAIFGPKLTLLLDLTYLCSFFYAILGVKKILESSKYIYSKLFIFSSMYVAITILVLNLVREQGVPNLSMNLFKTSFLMLAAVGIYTTLDAMQEKKIDILNSMIKLSEVTALTVILFFIFDDFRQLIFSNIQIFIYKDLTNFIDVERFSDVSIGGGAISVLFALTYLINHYVQKVDSINFNNKYLTPILMIIGALLTGRIGIILIFTIIFINNIKESPKRLFKIFLLTISFILILDYLFTNGHFLDNKFFLWGFEPYLNYLKDGSFISASSTLAITQFRFMDNFFDILFGIGSLKDGKGVMDSLFIQIITSSGLIVFMLFLVNYFVYSGFLFSKSRLNSYYLALFFFIVTITNLKDEYYGDSRGAFTFLSICIIFLTKVRYTKNYV